MRINYYNFPAMTDEERFEAYFEALALNPQNDADELAALKERARREGVHKTPMEFEAITITTAKKLLKRFGGSAYTQHFDRDGGLIESSEIKLKGNNSKIKYNRHL